VTTLQQALQLEADRGFGDLQGRRETFSAFLSRECLEQAEHLGGPDQAPLRALGETFARYAALDQDIFSKLRFGFFDGLNRRTVPE
jgi:ATP-dependent DNA helicase RecG